MKERSIRIAVVCAAAAGIAFVIAAGYWFESADFGFGSARSSLLRLTAVEDSAEFADRNIAALQMKRDTSNSLFRIGRRLVGPPEDPGYDMPSAGPLSGFLNNPEAQKNTRELLGKNADVIRELQTFYEQKGGVQAILSPEQSEQSRSIRKILSLYSDRMAVAVLERNRAQAWRILEESEYFLTVSSLPTSLQGVSDFNIALTIWQVEVFGCYINTFKLTAREVDQLTAQIQTLQTRLGDSFRCALGGECLALYRNFSAGDARISWRIDRYDDYFRQLERLPYNRWVQADRIFLIAEALSSRYCDFRNYSTFSDSLRKLRRETGDASPFVRNFCRPFWTLHRNGAGIYTQLQCELVKLAVLKYRNAEMRLPQTLAELSAVNLEKEAWIDPLTGRPFSYEVSPDETWFQVLHGGRNWGRAVFLP
ncbi:hypothetical protein [uncultured Victivallis sp.]|uniref:hypothetical protein n=1 Tax=uncultured Victivallis sp. TaxID=354118 RepID=UPI0025D31117|nr:hypothetical protein [uncultured Victivallis sp.]